ncbi:MAG: peptidoglycan bridge formation glycyltransferase FemA/FemB family protein [Bacilli bacterium]
MKFLELEEQEYKNFVEKSLLKSFYQVKNMDKLSEKKGYISYYVGIKENNIIVCATRLMAKKNKIGQVYFYAPRGPIMDFNNQTLLKYFTKEIKKFIKHNHGYVLHIDPLVINKERDIDGNIKENGIDNLKIIQQLKDCGYIHNGLVIENNLQSQGRWHFVLDIKNKSMEELYDKMRDSTKRKIRKAIKSGVEIRELDYSEIGEFKKITSKTSSRKQFADKSLDYYKTMYEIFNLTGNVKFLLARLNVKKYVQSVEFEINVESNNRNKKNANKEKIEENIRILNDKLDKAREILQHKDYINLSVAMFILYGKEIDYLFGGSYKEYLYLYSPYLLQDYMIRYGVDNKYEKYDFYGIVGSFNKNDPSYGVYDFKKGFGGYVEEYIGDFYLPINWFYKINKIIESFKK